MTKTFLAVLIFVLIAAGVYFAFSSQINSFLFNKQVTQSDLNTSLEQTITTPAPVVSTSSTQVEDDLTALERDLQELENADVDFIKELNEL